MLLPTHMPFGKHKDKPFTSIPSEYLHWVAEEFDDDRVATAADKEWQYREKHNTHWEEE